MCTSRAGHADATRDYFRAAGNQRFVKYMIVAAGVTAGAILLVHLAAS